MNKDQVKGRVKEAEGKIEKTVGQIQKEHGDRKHNTHDTHKHH